MSRVVLVLGMHRSGTSCLAGTLQEAGLHLGDVVTGGGQVKGNRENVPIVLLHDQVLRHSGGSWDAPPEHVRWPAEQKRLRDRIISGYADSPLWGFKDPRTVFTLDGWLEVLDDVRFVATFRHPVNVVRSLIARSGGGREDKWMDVWIKYNDRLLLLYGRYGFPIISFDLPQERYRRALIPIIESIGLKPPATLSFFEPEHRHHVESREEIPERAQRTYERLLDVAVRA